MRGASATLKCLRLAGEHAPIPGAPRSGDPGTHKHQHLWINHPALAHMGPGLGADAPIREWVAGHRASRLHPSSDPSGHLPTRGEGHYFSNTIRAAFSAIIIVG